MALSDSARAAFAFKKLLGLANTQNGNPFFSETVPSQISITTPEVIGEEIVEDPLAPAADNVQEVTCELQENPGDGFASGLGYNIVLQQGQTINFRDGDVTVDDGSGGSNPNNRKLRDFRITSGARRSIQVVPQKFNRELATASPPGYGYDLFRDSPFNNTNRIPRTSQTEWQVDPVAGILVAQSALNLDTNTARIVLYVYTGLTLDESLANAGGGGGGGTLSGLQGTQGPGIDIVEENLSTGEVRLAVALDDVITNSAPGDNDTTGIDFNYSETNQGLTREATLSVNDTYLANNYLERGPSSGNSVSVSTFGTYNFNAGDLKTDGTNVTISAENASLNSSGTLTLDGNLSVEDPNNTGNFGNITCVDLTELSSKRYKTDIRGLDENARDIISALEAKLFKYEGREDDQLGFIAEEVAEVLPQAVRFKDGEAEALNYGRVVPAVVEAVKDVAEENNRLKQRVEQLESQL